MAVLVSNAFSVADVIDGIGARAQRRAPAVVAHHTMLMETRAKANASGRPGPNVVTGDYRDRISSRVEAGAARIVGSVGTDAPQGRRLELGFSDVDSLGREVDQPPFPHFDPALDQTTPGFESDLAQAAT